MAVARISRDLSRLSTIGRRAVVPPSMVSIATVMIDNRSIRIRRLISRSIEVVGQMIVKWVKEDASRWVISALEVFLNDNNAQYKSTFYLLTFT